MNQITGEQSKKEKRTNKGQTSTQRGNRQQRIKELRLITKENTLKVFRRSNKIYIISHSRYVEKPRTSIEEVK